MVKVRRSRRAIRWLHVIWICNPETSLAVHDHVARLIVPLAVQKLRYRRGGAVVEKVDDAPPALLRTEHRSVLGHREAVHPAGPAAEVFRLAGRGIEAQHTLFEHRAHEHALAVPRKPAGAAFEGAGDEFEIPGHVLSPLARYRDGTPAMLTRVRMTDPMLVT